jgi:hypothetical protein
MESTSEDPVGYGRPPKQNQFKPGQSGNPKGRPKGARNLNNILEEELEQKVSVTENGRRQRVRKGRLAVRQQVNKAAQGDPKAFQAIARLQQVVDPGQLPASDTKHATQSELTEDQCLEALQRLFRDREGARP